MADNDQLLQQIGELLKAEREQTRKVVREEVKAETEPMKMDIALLKNGQAHNTTMVEAVLAGQQELQKTTAREATVLNVAERLTRKVNDHEERITELEKEAGIPHPHKH